MSPVFRHGGLRLYLLKLLDEAPRHGYEVIRLLQDRFLGVYAPSPGTIYPRLARLEEEGLVTHDEVDGRKVYRITDKGRAEINARLDDLAELEEDLTESVRDIAREVTEDVRETVRNLREELTWAAKDVRREGRERAAEDATDRARRAREEVRRSARKARDETRQGWQRAADDTAGPGTAGQEDDARHGRAGARSEWADWASAQNWQSWAGWRGRSGEWPWGHHGGRGWPGAPGLDTALFRDLERLAIDFARDLRKAAASTESIGENAVGDLRSILEDALTRIRNEVFRAAAGPKDSPAETGSPDATDQDPERDDDR
jgi:DNA-binding PadR family transcriptional regulator